MAEIWPRYFHVDYLNIKFHVLWLYTMRYSYALTQIHPMLICWYLFCNEFRIFQTWPWNLEMLVKQLATQTSLSHPRIGNIQNGNIRNIPDLEISEILKTTSIWLCAAPQYMYNASKWLSGMEQNKPIQCLIQQFWSYAKNSNLSMRKIIDSLLLPVNWDKFIRRLR